MDETENILVFVMRKLNTSRSRLTEISKASGVPYHTLTKIAQGVVADPRVSTVQRLVDYFRSLPPAEAPATTER